MKLDYLGGTDFLIDQGEEFYRMNSDTELLGRFIRMKHHHRFLEIGCNTGAILLYASLRKPKEMVGVDLFPEVFELTKQNLERYEVHANLHACKIQDFHDELFDVIACNPPYFSTTNQDLMNVNQYKRAGRHEENLPLSELFTSVKRLLKSNGSFFLVHRASRINEIYQCASVVGMLPVRVSFAYDHVGGVAKTVLIELQFTTSHECIIGAPVYLDDRSTFPTIE